MPEILASCYQTGPKSLISTYGTRFCSDSISHTFLMFICLISIERIWYYQQAKSLPEMLAIKQALMLCSLCVEHHLFWQYFWHTGDCTGFCWCFSCVILPFSSWWCGYINFHQQEIIKQMCKYFFRLLGVSALSSFFMLQKLRGFKKFNVFLNLIIKFSFSRSLAPNKKKFTFLYRWQFPFNHYTEWN